ncbi:MAG: DUF5131 family protein [Okeania sp. SIO3I5]|nr:DUF5131 family protein [Okeania sp. SIO3I5]
MKKTNIDLCDKSWNPVTGCNQISPGCANCYALEVTNRKPKNMSIFVYT